MAQRVNLLNPRGRNTFEALVCFLIAGVGFMAWIGSLPYFDADNPDHDEILGFLYFGLPFGLIFGVRQAVRAFGSPGVVIRAEGLQVGRKAVLPWHAVSQVRVVQKGNRRQDSKGRIVIELDTASAISAGVRKQSIEINVAHHETTVSWVLKALRDNASQAGVGIPGLETA